MLIPLNVKSSHWVLYRADVDAQPGAEPYHASTCTTASVLSGTPTAGGCQPDPRRPPGAVSPAHIPDPKATPYKTSTVTQNNDHDCGVAVCLVAAQIALGILDPAVAITDANSTAFRHLIQTAITENS